jgi:hypothetical protein
VRNIRFLALAAVIVGLAATPALAVPIVITVGDNDGYGFGVADNGPAVWPGLGPSGTGYDGRSAAEAAAVNGAQITDVYSAIFPGFGPNGSTASVLFPFAGSLTSGTLVIDMGDFQTASFGAVAANVNGIALPFAFNDGFQGTAVRSFLLTPAMIGAANLAGQVVLNLDHGFSADFVAFDYFELQGDVVPEPATIGLLGLGLSALALRRRRRS